MDGSLIIILINRKMSLEKIAPLLSHFKTYSIEIPGQYLKVILKMKIFYIKDKEPNVKSHNIIESFATEVYVYISFLMMILKDKSIFQI